jgi:hypothetical protein
VSGGIANLLFISTDFTRHRVIDLRFMKVTTTGAAIRYINLTYRGAVFLLLNSEEIRIVAMATE